MGLVPNAVSPPALSQVVDRVKGVHCVLRKRDFGDPAWLPDGWPAP